MWPFKNKKNKNISSKISNGRILQTKDKYLQSGNNFEKPGTKGNYRKAAVVDTNRNNELAVVKLTTSPKGKALPDYKQGKSKFKPFIETKDNIGKPIKESNKFVLLAKKENLSKNDVNKIKKDCLNNPRTKKTNKDKLRNLKGRK